MKQLQEAVNRARAKGAGVFGFNGRTGSGGQC